MSVNQHGHWCKRKSECYFFKFYFIGTDLSVNWRTLEGKACSKAENGGLDMALSFSFMLPCSMLCDPEGIACHFERI